MQPRITNPEGGPRESQTMAFIGGQQKSISPSENQGLIRLTRGQDVERRCRLKFYDFMLTRRLTNLKTRFNSELLLYFENFPDRA